MRTVSFVCPLCNARNVGAPVVFRETECLMCHTPIYFTKEWYPTLDPRERNIVTSLLGCLGWVVLLIASIVAGLMVVRSI